MPSSPDSYEVFDNGVNATSMIRFIGGSHDGMEVAFGKIKLDEKPNGGLILSFEHEVVYLPCRLHIRGKRFVNMLGNVLVDVVSAAYQKRNEVEPKVRIDQ